MKPEEECRVYAYILWMWVQSKPVFPGCLLIPEYLWLANSKSLPQQVLMLGCSRIYHFHCHFLFTCIFNLHISTTKKLRAQYCSKYYSKLWIHPVEYYRLSHYSSATLAQPQLACWIWWKQRCLAHTVILAGTSGKCTQEWQWTGRATKIWVIIL